MAMGIATAQPRVFGVKLGILDDHLKREKRPYYSGRFTNADDSTFLGRCTAS